MGKTLIKERIISTKRPEAYIVYTKIDCISVFSSIVDELKFNVNESPEKECWVLVHDGVSVLAKFFKGGKSITSTINNLICGTEKEINETIKKLGLKESIDIGEIK